MTAHRMINAPNAILDEAPEPLNRVGMDVAHNIDFRAVIDAPMCVLVPMVAEIVVNRIVVSENHALWKDVLFDDTHDGIFLNVQRGIGANAPLALNDADNGGFGIH